MKNCLLFLLLLCSLPVFGQFNPRYRLFEVGLMFGGTSYSGDLTYHRVELNETRAGFGVFVRYFANKNLSFKGHLYSGAISGDDKNSPVLYERSFRFGTNIYEWAAVAEWNFFNRPRITSSGFSRIQIVPYIYAGAGMTFANPEAEYYGSIDKRDIYLKVPFPEENLNHTFLLVPVGGGLRFDLSERLIFGLEGSIRPVFADGLDGVSQNGNPKGDDWYYFFGATASFILNASKSNQLSAY